MAVVGVDMAAAIGAPATRTLARLAVEMSREPCFCLFRGPMHGFCGVAEINDELRQRAEQQRPAPGFLRGCSG